MDKATRKHLARRGVYETIMTDSERSVAERNANFFAWFEESVMGFDSDEYRREFWREARRTGRSIGPKPYGFKEYGHGRGSIAAYFALMGISFFFWAARREIDRHIHRLRRPTYYETERARRLALAEERRKLRRRTTVNEKPSLDTIRDALAHALESVEGMVRLGSLMEDLECYVDNSPYFREDGSFAGRRGGIRRYLQNEAPDLYTRYKTLMRYKALSKKFRQAVGIGDPMPATAILPSAEKEFADNIAEECNRKVPEPAMKEMRTVFQRSRELISDCECSVASLTAQLALRVEPTYTPKMARATRGKDELLEGRGGMEKRHAVPDTELQPAVA